jgi:hypothetical protein
MNSTLVNHRLPCGSPNFLKYMHAFLGAGVFIDAINELCGMKIEAESPMGSKGRSDRIG